MPSNKPRCRSRRRGADPFTVMNRERLTQFHDRQICQCRRRFRGPVCLRGHFYISGPSIPVQKSTFGCQKPQRTMGKSGKIGVLPGREVGDSGGAVTQIQRIADFDTRIPACAVPRHLNFERAVDSVFSLYHVAIKCFWRTMSRGMLPVTGHVQTTDNQ